MNNIETHQLIETHTVPLQAHPQRLSDYLPGVFVTTNTRKGIKKAIDKGLVKVNGQKGFTGYWVKGGETIELFSISSANKKSICEITLKVLYEDEHLAIVSKPAGIAVSGNKKRTLEHALPFNLKTSPLADALPEPQAIHRLDYPTSGVLLIGKTVKSVILLNKMFENRQINKTYLAVTVGEMPLEGTIEQEIDGKAAHTSFKTLAIAESGRFGFLNLLEVKITSGRRHQIRKHMLHIGNPVLGDKEYGLEGKILNGKGLYLHAISLKFKHPITKNEIEIKDGIPEKFLKIFPGSIL